MLPRLYREAWFAGCNAPRLRLLQVAEDGTVVGHIPMSYRASASPRKSFGVLHTCGLEVASCVFRIKGFGYSGVHLDA